MNGLASYLESLTLGRSVSLASSLRLASSFFFLSSEVAWKKRSSRKLGKGGRGGERRKGDVVWASLEIGYHNREGVKATRWGSKKKVSCFHVLVHNRAQSLFFMSW